MGPKPPPHHPPIIPVSTTARGLIFDCDGTLADTMPLHWETWHETFALFGAQCPQAFLKSLTGATTAETVARFNQAFGYDLDAQEFARRKEERVRAKLRRAQPIEPVVAVVRQQRGRLPLAVASSGVGANVRQTLRAIGLAEAFDAIVTADDGLKAKPAPDIFLEAARRLAIDPRRCQVFEDSDLGLEAARRAGMIATDVRPLIGPG